MKIDFLHINGELCFNKEFGQTNFILGGNKSGKTTFIKLILYCLGVEFDDFIDEIRDQKRCSDAEIGISFGAYEKYSVNRKLPKSSVIVLTNLITKEKVIKSIDEYSAFLLEKGKFETTEIAYGDNKKATLRFYFLLRAMYIDQETPAYKLLADIGGRDKDFINNVKQLKKEIINALISKVDNDKQRTLLDMQFLIKERREYSNKIDLCSDILRKQYFDVAQKESRTLKRKIKEIKKQIIELTENNDAITMKSQIRYDKKLINDINELEDNRKEISHSLQYLELQKTDLKKTEIVFSNELDLLTNKDVIRDFITNIPIKFCPACSNAINISINGKCSLCGQDILEKNEEDSLAYKRMLEESIIEIRSLIANYDIQIGEKRSEYKKIIRKIEKHKKKYFESIDINIVNMHINNLAESLEGLIQKKEYFLSAWKLLLDKHFLSIKITSISDKISELSETVQKKDIIERENIDDIIENITSYANLHYKDIYPDSAKIVFDNELMPIIGQKTLSEISSASEKVVIRFLVLLSIMKISNTMSLKHPGIIFLDSPRDKDLDLTKYSKIIKLIESLGSGQVFFTGSIEDSTQFPKEVLIRMASNEKILKAKIS